VKCTPILHSDYRFLLNAFSLVQQLYDYIQDSIEDAKNQAFISEVKRRVDITELKGFDTFGSNKQFLKEGPVTILEGKSRKRRYIFLFSDLCLVTKPMTKNTKNFKYKRSILLEENDTLIYDITDSATLKCAFKITTSVSESVFIWKSQEEKDLWIREFNSVLDGAFIPRNGGKPKQLEFQYKWELSKLEKDSFVEIFKPLDTDKDGFIKEDQAMASLKESGLDSEVLSKIWNLSDRTKDKLLDSEEFCIAMFLVNAKLQYQELPISLPHSLIESLKERVSTVVDEKHSKKKRHKKEGEDEKVSRPRAETTVTKEKSSKKELNETRKSRPRSKSQKSTDKKG